MKKPVKSILIASILLLIGTMMLFAMSLPKQALQPDFVVTDVLDYAATFTLERPLYPDNRKDEENRTMTAWLMLPARGFWSAAKRAPTLTIGLQELRFHDYSNKVAHRLVIERDSEDSLQLPAHQLERYFSSFLSSPAQLEYLRDTQHQVVFRLYDSNNIILETFVVDGAKLIACRENIDILIKKELSV
jgi:hypothetical protein